MSETVVATFSIGPDDQALALLEQLRVGFLKHPRAGVALFDALVEEGNRYAQTPEGAALFANLESSPLVARLEDVFDFATLGILGEPSDGANVSALADAIFELALRDDAWRMNTRVHEHE